MNGIKEKAAAALKNGKLIKAVIICGIIGIALIFLSTVFDMSGKKTGEDSEFSVKTYSTKIESDLEDMISNIQGAGKTRVLLTMENSVEYVYLNDSSTKTKEVEPVIRGVLVVCEGGDNPVTVERITQAVTKALGVSTAKVCITKLSE